MLLEEIGAADRVVLLGDAIETRELPLPTVLEAARPFFEELGEAMAGREVADRPRQPRPPARRAAARSAGDGTASRSGSSTAPPAGEGPRPDRRLARRGRAADRLPRRLAPRRRLRDPRPLHGLPHEPAAGRVRRRGARDARLRPAPRAVHARPTTSGVLRPIYGFSFGLAQAGPGPPREPALRARLAGDLRPRPAPRRRPPRRAAGGGRGRGPGHRLDHQPPASQPTSTPTSPPRRSPAAGSTPRPRWRAAWRSAPPT